MSDRVYASIFYLAVVLGGTWVAVGIGESLTRQALTDLALISPAEQPADGERISRVEAFMAARDRAPTPQSEKQPLVPTASSMPAGALAKAMDEAEKAGGEAAPSGAGNDTPAQLPVAQDTDAQKPRVAGWVRRIPKRAVPADASEETSGRIIVRSLRAEL